MIYMKIKLLSGLFIASALTIIPLNTNAALKAVAGGNGGGNPNVSNATGLLPFANGGLPSFPVTNSTYGAKCDGRVISNVTATSGSPNVSSSSYTFVSGDIGKYITVPGAGATSSKPLNATISSISAGAAVLSVNAGTSVAGTGTATFGTSDTTAITAAMTAASTAGGGVVELPPDMCVLSSEITSWPTQVSLKGQGAGKSILKFIKLTDQSAGIIEGIEDHATCNANNAALQVDNQFRDFEIDAIAATLDGGYTVSAKGLAMACNTRSVVDHVYVHDTPATCIATDYSIGTWVTNNIATNCGRLGTTNFGSNGIGEAVGGISGESYVITGNIIVNPNHYGIFLESQSATVTQRAAYTISDNVIFEGTAGTNAVGGVTTAGIGNSGAIGGAITGNYVFGNSSSANWAGISQGVGTLDNTAPGVQTNITGNYISNVGAYGIGINYLDVIPGSSLTSRMVVSGNTVLNNHTFGIEILNNPTTNAIDGLVLNDNMAIGNGSSGIGFISSANKTALHVVMNGNLLANNGNVTATGYRQSGVAFAYNVTDLTAIGNQIYDNGTGTQKHGFGCNTAVTLADANISQNSVKGNATDVFDGVCAFTTSQIVNNHGYNPVGTTSPTPGASPWTFTNGTSPATLYLSGTLTGVTKNGVTIPGLVASGGIALAPNDAVVVTYPGAAPTAVLDTN